jgi:hypothetical protein
VFNDILYDPVLGSRLARLDFRGRRTLDWTGKLEAAGFIITADGLLPNYENLVDSIRNYHNTETQLDRPDVENTARHLIGFDEREYFTDLGVLDDAQFQFYQGLVRQKGTRQAIEKLERNELVTSINDELNVIEEWALRVGEFAGVCKNQYTEFLISASEVKVDPQLVQLSYPASSTTSRTRAFASTDVNTTGNTITITGHNFRTGDGKVYNQNTSTAPAPLVNGTVYYVVVVDEDTIQLATTNARATASVPTVIDFTNSGSGLTHTLVPYSSGRVTSVDIVSSGKVYTFAPSIFFINHPDDTVGSGAAATAVLDTDGTLLRIDIISQGSGYSKPPIVSIDNPVITAGDDRAIARITFDIDVDVVSDDVIVIDIDDETRWITKPAGTACDVSAELWPDAPEEIYRTTNSGYVHKDDITFTAFDRDAVDNVINNTTLDFEHGQTIWIARDPRETFGVYFMDNYKATLIEDQDETNFDNTGNNGTWYGGSGYAVLSRITLSDGSEVQVNAVANVVINSSINDSGTGYTVGDVLTVSGGTGTAATLTVDAVDDFGEVTQVSVTTGGAYTVNPTNPVSVTGGTGSSCTLNLVIADDYATQFTIDNSTNNPTRTAFPARGGHTLTATASTISGNNDFTLTVGTNNEESGASLDGDAATITMTGDGTATLTSLPREDVIKAQFTIDVAGTPSGDITAVTVVDGGFGYTTGGTFTVSKDSYGDERTTNDEDAIITYTVSNGVVDGATVTTPGSGYARNVDTVAVNAAGSGYSINDSLTLVGGTLLYGAATFDVTELTTIATQDETNFDGIPANEGSFVAGTGHAAGDIITLSDASTVTVDAASISTIKFQTQANFDGVGSNGTYVQASGYQVGDFIALQDGTVLQVTAIINPVVVGSLTTGDVSGFKITEITSEPNIASATVLTQASSSGQGTGFSITLGTNNEQTTSTTGVISQFTITTAGVSFKGSYAATTPGTTGVATTVLPTSGSGCTLDLTYTSTGITIIDDDVPAPIGWGRYLGNSVPNSGAIFAGGTLYDYTITSGLNVTLQKDGEDVANGNIAAGTPFFTLMNLRFPDAANRVLFADVMQFINVDTVWTDDNGSGLWDVSNVDGYSNISANSASANATLAWNSRCNCS